MGPIPASRFLDTIPVQARDSLRFVRFYYIASGALYEDQTVHLQSMKRKERTEMTKSEKQWESIWEKLSAAPSLHTVQLSFFDLGFRIPERRLLEPLRRVRAENLILHLPWPSTFPNTLKPDEEEPFKINRPRHGKREYRNRPTRMFVFPRRRSFWSTLFF